MQFKMNLIFSKNNYSICFLNERKKPKKSPWGDFDSLLKTKYSPLKKNLYS